MHARRRDLRDICESVGKWSGSVQKSGENKLVNRPWTKVDKAQGNLRDWHGPPKCDHHSKDGQSSDKHGGVVCVPVSWTVAAKLLPFRLLPLLAGKRPGGHNPIGSRAATGARTGVLRCSLSSKLIPVAPRVDFRFPQAPTRAKDPGEGEGVSIRSPSSLASSRFAVWCCCTIKAAKRCVQNSALFHVCECRHPCLGGVFALCSPDSPVAQWV